MKLAIKRKPFSPRAADFIAYTFLVFLPFAFFWRETLGRRTLGDQDAVFWFFPAYKFVAEQLRAGHLPLWSPYLYAGSPLFAEWQAGALDPGNWVYLLGVTSRTLTLSLQFTFVIALLATFSYTRVLGFTRRAAIVSAVIYALSGFLVGRTLYPGFLRIVALTPLLLCLTEKLRAEGRWRDCALGALVVAWQLFAAHPQPLIYSSLLACAYALYRVRGGAQSPLTDEPHAPFRGSTAISRDAHPLVARRQTRLRFLFQFALMFIWGAGLAAIQLLPAVNVAGGSVRQTWPYALFTFNSLHPVSLLVALFPFLHGSGQGPYRLLYWGNYWHHNEAQIYLGAVALALAAAGAVAAWRAKHSVARFWSVVAVFGVLLSLGKYVGPLATLLYHIPIIGNFRSPNRHWMEVALAVAVLSGYAVDQLLRGENQFIARAVQVAALLLALLVASIGTSVLLNKDAAEATIRALPDLHSLPQGFLRAAGPEFYLPMITTCVACLALLVFANSRRRAGWYPALLVVLLVDFNLYAHFAPISNPFRLEALIGQAVPKSLATSQNPLAPFRYHVALDVASGEFNPFWFYGHEATTGYDPLLDERQKTFLGIDEAGRTFNATMLDAPDRTLDLLGARYVFVAPSTAQADAIRAAQRDDATNGLGGLADAARWRDLAARSPVAAYDQFKIYENRRALPRVWLAPVARIAWEGDQLKLIRGELPGFDPRSTALVAPEVAARLDQTLLKLGSAEPAGTAQIIKRSPTRLVLETAAAAPSLCVLSEIFAGGWKASVDGHEAEVLRVDYDLRGVALAAGRHRIEMSYQPLAQRIGAAVSLTAALCLLALGIFSLKR